MISVISGSKDWRWAKNVRPQKGENFAAQKDFENRVRMQGSIVAALVLLIGHVKGVEKDSWGSDQVNLGRRQQRGEDQHGQRQQQGSDQHGQRAGLTDNIDLGARARTAHRSGKCELLS